MSKEETRKGIEDIISGKGYYFPVAETTQDILIYLNKLGVVIKGKMITFEGEPVGFEVEPLIEE